MVANAAHGSQTPLINALSVWLQIPEQCAYQAELAFLSDLASAPPTALCPD